MPGPARVFISYSGKDADLILRLKVALAAAGVAVWLDHEQLTPDTFDWQEAVRRGILQATHVIYAASPTAARSQYVVHEITMAKGEGKAVLPFWIRGEKWYDCIPMGWILAQYTDGREAAYDAGLAKLLAALGAAPPATPATPPAQPAPAAPPTPNAPRPIATQAASARIELPTAAPAAPPLPRHPLPDVPARLASLGFRGVNVSGAPAIVPPLVSVAAGPFLMGSAASDKYARDAEKPQHRAELPAFQIGKYPVTVAEYAIAVRTGAVCEPPEFLGVTWQTQLRHFDHPAVCVSWQDAQAYIAWLRQVTGEAGWRLPSEAQWEKAARWDTARGASRIYPWGNSFDPTRCNTLEGGPKTTTPIDIYPASDARRSGASPCGAEDMAGNVWEWTSSLFKPYPYAPSDGYEDHKSTVNRILRGGSWGDYAKNARAAYRSINPPDFVYSYIGFRLAFVGRSAGS